MHIYANISRFKSVLLLPKRPILPRERESQMLQTQVIINQNPWEHRVPTDVLASILLAIADERADYIETNYKVDGAPSFAVAIADPTVSPSRDNKDAILAIILIGPDAKRLMVNAIAKMVWHREHGQMAGYGAYVDPLTSADGDFAWGYSCQVNNLIGGGSGLTQEGDLHETGHILVSFDYEVRLVLKAWFDGQESRPGWYCNSQLPGRRYTDMVTLVNDNHAFGGGRALAALPEGNDV